MRSTSRFFLLIAIMTTIVLIVTIGTTVVFYNAALAEQEARLEEIVKSRASIITSIAEFDQQYSTYPEGFKNGTIEQLVGAHEKFEGFGKTGEFTFAVLKDNNITFLISHRHGGLAQPEPVPFDTDLAEPMRQALSGNSGTLTGLDYRGETVLAAYEPIPIMDAGIVAKIDMTEIQAPFVEAALLTITLAIILIIIGAGLFINVSNPMIRRIEENEEKFRSIFESNLIGTIFWNASGEITEANDAFLDILGYSREDIDNGALKWTELTPPGYEESDMKTLRELATIGIVKPSEKEYCHKDGHRVPVIVGAATLKDQKESGVAFILDISEKKKIEEAREQLHRALEAKNQELEQVIHATSHDLRSPLVNIQGFNKELAASLSDIDDIIEKEATGALREKLLPIINEDIPESLSYIRVSSEKMDALLRGLLTLSRMGRIELNKTQLDMNELMSAVIKIHEFKIQELDVEINVEGLPPCIGDADLLNQVFANLLENSIKFLNPEKPGIINITGKNNGAYSTYCIEDNGRGISSEYKEKVFQIFHKLDKETMGDGMGLSIVKNIIDKHNGKVWIEPGEMEGTKVLISLPFEQSNKLERGGEQ